MCFAKTPTRAFPTAVKGKFDIVKLTKLRVDWLLHVQNTHVPLAQLAASANIDMPVVATVAIIVKEEFLTSTNFEGHK